MFGRALLLRCPNCGSGGLFPSFFKLRRACPSCGLRLDRGESDYWLGAYMLNLVAVEMLFAALMFAVIVWRWPNPPWDLIQWGGIVLVLLGPFVCYPLARTTWLAMDLLMRPMSHAELEWHRRGGERGDEDLPHI